jgi:hypothetical protein
VFIYKGYRNKLVGYPPLEKITLLRVTPTMTFIHVVTGKSFLGILSDILSGILHGISSGTLSGISSGILSGGPAVHTELGRSQVEVQRCILSWEIVKELGEKNWQRI